MKEKKDTLSPEIFNNPFSSFRPMPFWGFNDLLEDNELRKQIIEMKLEGWGGFFMHPRYAMETPYLAPEYMDRVKTCIDEARRQNMPVWIYDEHPFPSGGAGGLVGSGCKDYRHKVLVMRIHNRLTPIEEGIKYFSVTLDKNGIPKDLTEIIDPNRYTGRDRLFLHFYIWTEPLHQANQPGLIDNIIHGFCYADTLKPEAARRFIDITYEEYKKSIGDEFGKTVTGVFADIPMYHWHYGTPHPSIPWTNDFPQYFESQCGYNLLPHLPSLFFDLGDYEFIRCDYWRIANQLFLESYTKQMVEWCDRHNLIYTAHYWGEETLHWQIPWAGDVMTQFVHQKIISIDHSIRNIEDPIGVKQASSVSEQFGKSRTISETYGMSGHSLSYEDRKLIGDWEYALGINFLVPYIAHYSFRGRRKRDEPASLFIQEPYWKYEHLLNDYYGRLSYILSCGNRVVDILVLQPLASARALYKPSMNYPQAHRPDPDSFEGAGAELFEYSQKFIDLCDILLQGHRDFHLGNEILMAEYGKISDQYLCIGNKSYSLIIIPPSITWSSTTVELLEKFCNQGGNVLAIKELPIMVDGKKSNACLPSKVQIVENDAQNILNHVASLLPADVVIQGGSSILYQHRQFEDEDIYFFTNSSQENSYPNTYITLPGTGVLELWDAWENRRYMLPHKTINNETKICLNFYPATSYLIIQRKKHIEKLKKYFPLPQRFKTEIILPEKWDFLRLDPNAITLDYCQVQIQHGSLSEMLPVWKAFRLIRDAGIGATFRVYFQFKIGETPKSLFLGTELSDRYQPSLNGELLNEKSSKKWWDPCIDIFDISKKINIGKNIIEISGVTGVDTEIENPYLLGDFSVFADDGSFVIKKEFTEGAAQNLIEEGYPFYCGRMVLSQEVIVSESKGKAYICFDRINAIIAQIRINKKTAGHLAWKPYCLDITEYLVSGKNSIEIEIATSMNNLLGPHHNKNGEVKIFVLQQKWTDELNWTDNYYFVPFGISNAKLGFISDQENFN